MDDTSTNKLPQPQADDASYCIRMVTGPAAGKTWVLTEEVTAIGRGIGCAIRLEDSFVSRVQCELIVSDGNLRFRSVGQRNPTYINEAIREEAELTIGDTLSFAGFRFIVDCVPMSQSAPRDRVGILRTTQTFADTAHLRNEFVPSDYSRDPTLSADLHGLLRLIRTLGRLESPEALTSNLTTHLRARFKTPHVWIGWKLDTHDDFVLNPPAPPDETRKAPFGIMLDACHDGRGVMQPGLGAQGEEYLLAAPLIHGRDSFGAIAVHRPNDHAAFTLTDLQYLVAVAECCAPLIRAAERMEQLRRDTRSDSETSDLFTSGILGDSPATLALRAELRQAAVARVNVLLQGETGVGKELAARMLHDLSPRCQGPYVAVNCAAIPEELFESEVFGHVRGAFTGASRTRKGLFELAHGGTLFLDEVGDLSATNQARLLRAVDTGVFRPVGSEKDIQVDVRILSATNRRLPDRDQTFFRADLYHRLAAIVVQIRPLREHKEDIRSLADHFLRLASAHVPTHPKGFTQEAYATLESYDWPGNVRELRNVVERSCFTTKADHISSRDIRIEAGNSLTNEVRADSFDELEHQYILSVLRRNDNNVVEAARFMGISRSTLYYKLAKYGIKPRSLRKQ
ncbi:MAG: sigma 54-interacting transcriptional regulator [Candidatus Hydrogenedentes bacterium]|nr:sigma 54-interacting transcriptional regulator [Candidatus Hydrogenedentota bacterium]